MDHEKEAKKLIAKWSPESVAAVEEFCNAPRLEAIALELEKADLSKLTLEEIGVEVVVLDYPSLFTSSKKFH